MASAAASAASAAAVGSYGQGKFIQDGEGRFYFLSPAGRPVPAEKAMETLASPAFGAYMRRAVPVPFPFKGLLAAEQKVSIWNGRKVTVFHGESASKAVVSGWSLREIESVGRGSAWRLASDSAITAATPHPSSPLPVPLKYPSSLYIPSPHPSPSPQACGSSTLRSALSSCTGR